MAKRMKYSADSEMCKVKLEEMEKGEVTDFSFLVGPDKGNPQLLHCFKSDLILASDYFKALLRSPLTEAPPVRIKLVEPHIFKLILRFIATHRMEEISNLEDALALGLAADEFLMESLKEYCLSELEKFITVSNVWQILNDNANNPLLQFACAKVLSSKTRECLGHQNFLEEACPNSITFFLQLDELNVASEKELVDAVLKLANHKFGKGDAGCDLMKAALPHLRLLTLRVDEITPDLLNHLTETEGFYLTSRLCSKTLVADRKIPDNLNPNTEPRYQSQVEDDVPDHFLNMIPDSLMLNISDPTQILKVGYHTTKYQDTMTVCLTTKSNVALTGMEFLTPGNPALEFSAIKSPGGSRRMKPEEKTEVNWTVDISYGHPKKCIFSQKVRETCKYFSTIDIKFKKNVVIPKGFAFRIDFTQNARRGEVLEKKNPHIVHHRIFSASELKRINNRVIKSGAFSNLQLSGNKRSQQREVILKRLQYFILEN